MGIRNGLATKIQKKVTATHKTNCHGHALNLAVKNTTKKSRLFTNTMSTTKEICTLVKFSPKREQFLANIKKDMDIEAKGIKVLCPTRWTVRAESFQRIIDNYAALQSLWDKSLQTDLDSEMRGRIIGVKTAMPTLEYYFGVSIGIIIFSMTDNLSKTLQKQRMSSIQGQQMAMSTKEAILQMRNDATFDLFYKGILEKAQKLGIVEPEPSRRKNVPKFLHDYFGYSDTPEYVPETVKDSYRVM